MAKMAMLGPFLALLRPELGGVRANRSETKLAPTIWGCKHARQIGAAKELLYTLVELS